MRSAAPPPILMMNETLFARASQAREVRRKMMEHNPYADTVNRGSVEEGRRHAAMKKSATLASTIRTTASAGHLAGQPTAV